MRFVISGEWTRNRLLRIIMFWLLAYVIGLWVTNLLLYVKRLGFTYSAVVSYYRGNEEQFLPPRSFLGLLETSHFHLFAMAILVVTLTHLLLFVPFSQRAKFWLILFSFVGAMADEAGGWLVRFAHPYFAVWKIAAFLLLQGSLALLIGFVLHALLTWAPNGYAEESPAANPIPDPPGPRSTLSDSHHSRARAVPSKEET